MAMLVQLAVNCFQVSCVENRKIKFSTEFSDYVFHQKTPLAILDAVQASPY